jgi:hypothetical protein
VPDPFSGRKTVIAPFLPTGCGALATLPVFDLSALAKLPARDMLNRQPLFLLEPRFTAGLFLSGRD